MAKQTRPTTLADKTAHFILYDARSGAILAVHHVTALPGVRVPSEALVQKRVLACAAEALGRNAADLRVLATPEAQTILPGLRVDASTGTLSTPGARHGGARDDRTDGESASGPMARLRSP